MKIELLNNDKINLIMPGSPTVKHCFFSCRAPISDCCDGYHVQYHYDIIRYPILHYGIVLPGYPILHYGVVLTGYPSYIMFPLYNITLLGIPY